MKIIIKIFKFAAMGLAAGLFFLALGAGLVYMAFYEDRRQFSDDMEIYSQMARLELFNRGYIQELSQDDVRYVYQKRCYKQCHGEAAMITAVLSPAGWIQVVERMRLKENVDISGREVDVIIKYLEEKYPTVKSSYSYEVRKKIHHAVWRNDMGQGDIYCDVNYATQEYLKSIGAEHLIDEYGIADHDVFVVSFTVHEGEVALHDLDNIVYLKTPAGRFPTVPPWRLRFQTADKHHYEAEVRFKRVTGGDAPPPWMELEIENVGGPKTRVFRWELPIKYPEELAAEEKELAGK